MFVAWSKLISFGSELTVRLYASKVYGHLDYNLPAVLEMFHFHCTIMLKFADLKILIISIL